MTRKDNEKNLYQLKADCLNIRGLAETFPDNKKYQRDYEKAQRAVQAKEREVFCGEGAK